MVITKLSVYLPINGRAKMSVVKKTSKTEGSNKQKLFIVYKTRWF